MMLEMSTYLMTVGAGNVKWNSNSVELPTLINGVNSQSPEMTKDPARVIEDESYAKATTYCKNLQSFRFS